ncbi:unnamed protein product [Soboliphyme baturini]|uniref:Secreted protein n=1 Tax=Soboliphyme baturini TaxID=241478 RepID=A0A183IEL2_9BILA|nr:unnamed protein product [Soboliphyme baturini]
MILLLSNFMSTRSSVGLPKAAQAAEDGEKLETRACFNSSGSWWHSSTAMTAEDRQEDDEETNEQRSRYSF